MSLVAEHAAAEERAVLGGRERGLDRGVVAAAVIDLDRRHAERGGRGGQPDRPHPAGRDGGRGRPPEDRPANWRLDCAKSRGVFGIEQKPWQAGLESAMKLLEQQHG